MNGIPGRLLAVSLVIGGGAEAARGEVPVEHFRLANGMTFLVVERPAQEMVAAVWAVRSGSGDEAPGRTGTSHLLEHLLFAGSEVIGTRDWERERELIRRRDHLARDLERTSRARRRQRLELDLAAIDRELEGLRIEGELAYHYAQAGAVGLDARTTKDFSLYSVMVPASRLELWFWLESDRLLHPVFRGLHRELAVLEEERRGRLESTPFGLLLEDFDRRFWGRGHPYSWSADGLPGDLRRIDRLALRRHYRRAYVAGNLVAAIVGDVDRRTVRTLAERYFGRLERGSAASALGSPRVSPPPQPVEVRRNCDCRSQVELRYPTVSFAHPDAAALELVAALLNGRDGRLQRRVVQKRSEVFAASARHNSLRRAGTFSLFAQAREGPVSLERLADWLQAEVVRLIEGEVDPQELQRLGRQLATETARQAKEPLALAQRLAVYEALGDWRAIDGPEAAAAAAPHDIKRVAALYLRPELRSVLQLQGHAAVPAVSRSR